jgi:hypothetical protein
VEERRQPPAQLYALLLRPERASLANLTPRRAVDYQLIKEKSGAVIAYEYFSQGQTLIANETDRTR